MFDIINLNSSENYFHGGIVLKEKLNYNDKEVFEFLLEASVSQLYEIMYSFYPIIIIKS